MFVNPPYSNPRPWIEKTIEETRNFADSVVMLLPAATDTTWFHDLVLPHADVIFMRGRIRFHGPDGKPRGTPKAGTILAVFPKRPQVFGVDEGRSTPSEAAVPGKA